MQVKVLAATLTLATCSWFTTPAFALIEAPAVREIRQNQLYPADASRIGVSLISQAINKTVYVLIFNSHTDHEGIHTIFFNGRNKVLMFESVSDAKDFAKNLIREKPADLNVPIPVVEAFNSQEIITFCQTAGYDYELISAGGKIEPPLTWVEKLSIPSITK
ncbi:DUF3110 domain-containing protein [Nostoc sphaeroides]|uniref:Uncharacterized protein n=1 Tax=Nostoc sphaeroides CCNUC1 TaxID=2653204 RepID=A0A5P8WAT5_9NOSO|nr:DUF3110 domain-containing protein [Nostoc sphaeroides]QFS49661.1 hypothetical protein GXM_07155 [Nostoc sphaeroides CCNUC1]